MTQRSRTALVQLGVLAGLAACLVAFRDQLPDPGALWDAVVHADPVWLGVAIIAQAGSMATFARLQRRLLRAGGHLMTAGRAYTITYAANAVSESIPAGAALGAAYTYRQYRRSGATTPLAMATMLLSGLISLLALAGLGLLALLAMPEARGFAVAGLAVLAVLAVAVVCVVRSPRVRRLPADRARRPRSVPAHVRLAPPALLRRARPYPDSLVPARPGPISRWASELGNGWRAIGATPRDLGVATVWACLNRLLDMVTLIAAAVAVGLDVPVAAIAVGFFAGQLAGMLPILPGGLGAVEGSLLGTLVAFGAAAVPAAAVVFLYRVVSYWLVVGIGWLAWLALHLEVTLPARDLPVRDAVWSPSVT